MKVKVVIELDTDTSEFTTQFFNMSSPGEGMDYGIVNDILKKIFRNVDEQVGNAPSDDEQIIKMVH